MSEKPVVLLVDDVPANIQMLASYLKDDYQIKVAIDGQRAIELSQNEPQPDLILLDISMPEIDGYQVCAALKKDVITRNIPVIFVTAMDSDSDEEQGLRLGAVDYITKPFRPAIVQARVATQIKIKQQSDALRNMALRDQLTGLFNRHYLIEVATQKLANAIRHNHALAVLMIDVDYFKQINDQHGHQVGDSVLEAIGSILNERTRKEDIAARLGGEEFVMILEYCSQSHAIEKAEALRACIQHWKPKGIEVTASFGVAVLKPGMKHFNSLLKQADLALYQAKEQGRNRVVMYQGELDA